MVDLHTHSTASDGSLKPEALIEEASQLGLKAIALTDHDTLDGLEKAKIAASDFGIKFIPGIELQINWRMNEKDDSSDDQQAVITNKKHKKKNEGRGEFHLLGLGLKNPGEKFFTALDFMREARKKRNFRIIELMKEQNIKVEYEDILALSGGKIVGRPHFAVFLVKNRIVKNMEQAFTRYLAPGKAFYVPKTGLKFAHAAALIKESGGIAVLAHPMSLYVSWGKFPDLLANLKERGLDGIEAWHPAAKTSACSKLEILGKNLDLLITAGSDFHGENRPERKLGFTSGGKKIDDSFFDRIMERL